MSLDLEKKGDSDDKGGLEQRIRCEAEGGGGESLRSEDHECLYKPLSVHKRKCVNMCLWCQRHFVHPKIDQVSSLKHLLSHHQVFE